MLSIGSASEGPAPGNDHASVPRGTTTRLRLAQVGSAASLPGHTRHSGSNHDPLRTLAPVLGQRAVIVGHSGSDPVIEEMNLFA